LVVGAGLFALFGGSGDPADTGTGTENGEEAITSSTTGSADLAPTRSATLTTTTGPEAPVDTEAQETPTEAISPPAVAHLREILADGGLDSGLLTDANLEDFGDTFCVFAAVADDSTEFAELRARTTGQSTADGPDAADALTEEELARTIDAAVVAFCPDQAERLGLVG
jgi:hypothetical protein